MDKANMGPQFEEESGLSDREKSYLDFEAKYYPYRHTGMKENAIVDTFDHSATRYYQILGALVNTTRALDYNPVMVKGLRKRALMQREARSVRGARVKLPHEFND